MSEITYLAQNQPNYSLSEIKPRRPPASGIALKKAAPPAPSGGCFFYNHVLPCSIFTFGISKLSRITSRLLVV
jgi:hypothetical protein